MRGRLLLLAALSLGLRAAPEVELKQLYVLEGDLDGDEFGAALSSLDIDSDGTTDIAVGAPGDSTGGRDAGAVHVFSGRTRKRLAVLHGQAGERFGQSVALMDVNADTLGDLVVGAPGHKDGAGAVYVVPNVQKEHEMMLVVEGKRPGDELGAWVCAAPAVPGENLNGILIGSPGHDEAGRDDAGRAFVMRIERLDEKKGKATLTHEWTGADAGARLGAFVGLAGDVDEDQTQDLFLGEPGGLDHKDQPTGALRLIDGDNGKQLQRFTGRKAGDLYGSTAASVRLHGKGVQYHEVLVGARGYAQIWGSRKGELRKTFEADAADHDFGLVVGGRFQLSSGDQFGFSIATSCFEGGAAGVFHGVRVYSGASLEEVARLPATGSRLGLAFAVGADGTARETLFIGESRPGHGRVRVVELKQDR